MFKGPVSEAFRQAYRPDEAGEKQEYFDRVFGKRDYVLLGVHCHTEEDPDIHLPCIKYISSVEATDEQAQKRMRVEEN